MTPARMEYRSRGGPTHVRDVATWAEASRVFRTFIIVRDLGVSDLADPGGAVVLDASGEAIGRVSYNGRCWDTEGREVDIAT